MQLPGEKYYIATMQIYDEEGQKKVDRHRKLRQGKGFITIENPTNVDLCFENLFCAQSRVALLECMSNLVANEMFGEGGIHETKEVITKITEDIRKLSEKLEHLVIVTNNVFEDGICYDASTMEYLKALGSINCKIAEFADEVTEVVVGIPVVIKKKESK